MDEENGLDAVLWLVWETLDEQDTRIERRSNSSRQNRRSRAAEALGSAEGFGSRRQVDNNGPERRKAQSHKSRTESIVEMESFSEKWKPKKKRSAPSPRLRSGLDPSSCELWPFEFLYDLKSDCVFGLSSVAIGSDFDLANRFQDCPTDKGCVSGPR